MLMKPKELANTVGVSGGAISNAVRRGLLVKRHDGLFDSADKSVAAYIAANSDQRRAAKRATGKIAKTARKPIIEAPVDAPPPSGELQAENMDLKDQLDAERIEKLRIENAASRGELIPRATVEVFMGKLWSVHTSTILPMGQRLAPAIAAHLGRHDPESTLKAQELIDDTLYSAMSQIERRLQDFLTKTPGHGAGNLTRLEAQNE